MVNPSGQATDASAYIKQEIRLIGAGQGLSYETVSRDMSESNYSSARQGVIEDDLTYMEDKEQLLEIMDEIYESFVDSLVLGMKTLTYSASFFEDEEEEILTEDEARKQEKKEKLIMNLTVVVSVLIAVGIFMVLPYYLSSIIEKHTSSHLVMTVLEGVIRVAIFLIYIVLISRTKDIKRTFMYHGAEHKCINCIEHGLELNVENVRKSSKQHKRCGTSFLFFVMIVSIIVCFFITAKSQIVRVLLRIALLPLIAGISYELIRLAGNSDHPVINVLSKPGLWVQNLTTKEPDDSMIEVGIKAVEAVFDWKTWQEENLKQ